VPRPSGQGLAGRLCALGATRLVFVPKAHLRARRTPEASGSHAAVDVLQADDVLLIELSEGDLKYPHRLRAWAREPVNRLAGYEELLLDIRVEDLPVQLYTRPGVEGTPPGATVRIFTVQGRSWVYCSNLPQGFSTFREGGR
jgi:hypothetical protein